MHDLSAYGVSDFLNTLRVPNMMIRNIAARKIKIYLNGIYVKAMIRVFSNNHKRLITAAITKSKVDILPKPGISLKSTFMRTIAKVAIMLMTGKICINRLDSRML